MIIDELVSQYNQNGYVIASDLLDPTEIAQLRQVTDSVAATADQSGEETPVFDFERVAGTIAIQRIKKPHRVDPFYMAMARHPKILGFLERVIGPNIRLSHSKINMKSARGGSALEWHQDWAFAPHTAMQTCVASVMIDDAGPENGAMQVIPGSHKGPLLEHHDSSGYFVGAIKPNDPSVDWSSAALLSGPAGTISFHHPLMIHGSSYNTSGQPRRILFLEYAAAEAYPLFYSVDWTDYESRMVQGVSTSEIRLEPNRIKLPFPSRAGSSIYKIQADLGERSFVAAQ
jgi:ectoine hydroxylase-related dioxygenase (phytanoyl-CoA dioxygenase family)